MGGFSTLIGYSHFFAGDYITDSAAPGSGNDEDQDFLYIQLAYTF